MPDRYPKPRHEPPSRWDHALAHPGLVVAAAWWAVVGTITALGALTPGTIVPSTTVAALPVWVALIEGTMVGAGGGLTLWGVITTHPRLDTVWTVQKIGLHLAGAAWSAYAVGVIVVYPHAVTTWGNGLAHTALAMMGIAAIRRQESDTRGEMQSHGMPA